MGNIRFEELFVQKTAAALSFLRECTTKNVHITKRLERSLADFLM